MKDNIYKTLYFDFRTWGLKNLSVSQKIKIIVSKYISLLQILFKGSGTFKVGKSKLAVHAIGDVGTIHSNIVDVHDEIIAPGVVAKKSPHIVDVGANIGQFSGAIKLFYPNAKIIAFEPDNTVYTDYARNMRESKGIKPYNFGLGDRKRKATFYKDKLSVKSTFAKNEYTDSIGSDTLEVRTLDSFNLKNIDLLKIDVEGFEAEVLKGAKQSIKKSKFMLLELSLGRGEKTSNIDILKSVKALSEFSRIVKFGRPLGNKARPTCQDVLIKLEEPDE